MVDHIFLACAHLCARLCTRCSVVPRRPSDVRACERVGALPSLVVSSGRGPRVFAGPGRGPMRVVVLPGVGRTAPAADVVRPVGVGMVVPVCVCTRGRAGALRHCAVVCSSAGRVDEGETCCMEWVCAPFAVITQYVVRLTHGVKLLLCSWLLVDIGVVLLAQLYAIHTCLQSRALARHITRVVKAHLVVA